MRAIRDLLVQAIHRKRVIAFRYQGGAERTAEPHDYGVSHGRERLLAYQLTGDSSSGSPRGWKDLVVEDIAHLRMLDQVFAGSRGHETHRHRLWDELFARVD